MRLIIFILVLIANITVHSENLVLFEDKIGGLALSAQTRVSVESLSSIFPNLKVVHGIGQGDSLDFHYFELMNSNHELMFKIKSFITGANYDEAEVPIDILVVYSKLISDQYGVSIGFRYEDVVKARGEALEFGASHFDNYLGRHQIWYTFTVRVETEIEGLYESPERIKIGALVTENPMVNSISWPKPRW